MSSPFFSVIIPTYNRESFVLKSIYSVVEQTYQDYELIIIDDGSTDNTCDIVKPMLSDRIFYYKINNSERGAARNFGISKAIGEYVTFLDSDDIYYSNYLSNAFNSLKKMHYPKFYDQAYEVKTEKNKVIRITRPDSSNYYKAISKGNFMSCMGVFIQREVTQRLKFNEDRDLSGSEDWEYWVRLMASYGLKISSEVCSAMIVHEDRSVLTVSEQSLIKRKNLAMQYAFENIDVIRVFGKYKRYMSANWDTYISLHLMIDKQFKKGIKYFIQAVKTDAEVLLDRRTLSIIKLYLLSFLRFRKK